MISDASHWSKAADDATKEAFHVSELGLLGEVLHCKHLAGGFGTVRVASILQGRIELFEKTADRMTIFETLKSLFALAGQLIERNRPSSNQRNATF